MSETVADAPDASSPPRDRVGRATLTITVWNLISRVTGFGRVIITGAALGIRGLGDTYQSANVVSNILFELLAGGLLYSVLVPTFVRLIDEGRRGEVARLGASLLGRLMAGLAAIALVGALCGNAIMRVFTIGGDAAQRSQQIQVGSFLLWFFLPQLVLYGAGAVSTALLQADRRFLAAAAAPVANNVVVTAVMAVFLVRTHHHAGLDLSTSDQVLLGLGTTLGVVAMTAVVVLAVGRAQLWRAPRWRAEPGSGLGSLARKGLWGAGHVGLNQIMVFATLVLAHQVTGGQAAYQMAFTFFLLPHALLGNPLFTAIFPKLSADHARGDLDTYASDLSFGARVMTLLILPASVLLAVLALPALRVLQGFGQLDAAGVGLVALVLAGFSVGLLGYSGFFLLTRASYALDDVRSPTLINLVVTVVAVAGMTVAAIAADGDGKVAVLGLVQAVAVTAGSAVLLARLRRMVRRPVPLAHALVRGLVASGAAALAAAGASRLVGWGSRPSALAAVAVGSVVGLAAYVVVLAALRAPELAAAWQWVNERLKRRKGTPGVVGAA